MKENSYDPVDLEPYLWKDIEGDTAWDLGCSYGNTMTNMIYRFKTVIGFEPSKVAIAYLKTIPSIKGVQVYELAISKEDGKVELDLEEGHVKVSCRSVDSLTKKLPMPDFIKADVLGHEVEVLKGSIFTLITRAPDWLIEVYSADNGRICQDILAQYGYYNTIILDPDDRDPINHYWIRSSIPKYDR